MKNKYGSYWAKGKSVFVLVFVLVLRGRGTDCTVSAMGGAEKLDHACNT